MIFLGIDLGTSSLKAIAIDERGSLLGQASRDIPVYYPKNSWAEQDPEDWWIAARDCIKELSLMEFFSRDEIRGIGLSGQMHGLVVLDKNNQVLHPAILWCDQRTQAECDEITDCLGREKLSELTGNKALTGFTAPKILWLKKNKPDIYKNIGHIMLPKDYIRFKLTGEYATDMSDASGMLLLDVKSRSWSREILEYLELKDEVLPKLYESYQITGYVTESMKNMLGLKGNIAVVGGAGDQAAGAVGNGNVEEGMISVTLGTSGVVFASHRECIVDSENRLHAFCHANGKYHSMGVILSAASSLKWWVESVNKDADFDTLLAEAEDSPSGSNGLIFLPYLMGERTPYADPDARACFIGLTMRHTRGDMTRAILEGVSFALRNSIDILRDMGIKASSVRAIGGGTKSSLWVQILADVFNSRVDMLNTNEGGALGAAILAAVSAGVYETVEEGCRCIVKTKKSFTPDRDNVEKYNKYYSVYNSLYESLNNSFKALSEI